MSTISFERSSQLARKVGAQPGICWQNAYKALRYLPEATYVEGWVVTSKSKLAIEHGWLEYQGEIVDPTFVLSHQPADLEKVAYFAGARYTKAEAARLKRKRRGDLPLVWAYGWGGEDHPEYMAAYQQAVLAGGQVGEPSVSSLILIGTERIVDGEQRIYFDPIAADAGIAGSIWYEVNADTWGWYGMSKHDAEFVIHTVLSTAREIAGAGGQQ